MKNPYMRPDRRVRPGHVKWWFHGYYPVYGRIMQRLSPNEVHVVRPVLNDLSHKIQVKLYINFIYMYLLFVFVFVFFCFSPEKTICFFLDWKQTFYHCKRI